MKSDGKLSEGHLQSTNDKEIVFQNEGETEAIHVDRASVARIIVTDDHGGVRSSPTNRPPATAQWNVPKAPTPPPMARFPATTATYYVIPLHGAVGSTILADALEKSLVDAITRKATVVVLDIDSPGGLVDEALKIIRVIGHYNKQIKIVALTDQDLSAAAILSLSVKKIYVKPTSTIGAATSYIPSQPNLSAKIEEKMQSAWRAAARNSAEEGGHEPLLAEAMIDTDLELHLETVGGKPVIKEGHGDKPLCRKGRILTLTSHEAVACGLAAGSAEDYAELGRLLGYDKWSECKGLGTLLADYLPKQNEAFESQMDKLSASFLVNLDAAKKVDPSGQNVFTLEIPHPSVAPTHIHTTPGRPTSPVPAPVHAVPPTAARPNTVRVAANTREWKQNSLRCVVALQDAEQNLVDVISLCKAFGHDSVATSIGNAATQIAAIRAKIYDDRNRYGAGATSPFAAKTPTAKPAAAAQTPAETAAKLKQIDGNWQTKSEWVELLAKMNGKVTTHGNDGSVMISRRARLVTDGPYRPPVAFRLVVKSDERDTRLSYGAKQIIFNWEMDHDAFRIDGGPASGKNKDGVGRLPLGQWVGIELIVNPDEMTIFIDGAEKYRVKADFSKVNDQFSIGAQNGDVWIKSVSVSQPKPVEP